MSLAQNAPSIDGWDGPFYPQGILELAAALNTTELDRALYGIHPDHPSYVSAMGAYPWYWLLQFDTQSGIVLVAIPGASDEARYDGSVLDRCPALYSQGPVGDGEMEDVVARLVLLVNR